MHSHLAWLRGGRGVSPFLKLVTCFDQLNLGACSMPVMIGYRVSHIFLTFACCTFANSLRRTCFRLHIHQHPKEDDVYVKRHHRIKKKNLHKCYNLKENNEKRGNIENREYVMLVNVIYKKT